MTRIIEAMVPALYWATWVVGLALVLYFVAEWLREDRDGRD